MASISSLHGGSFLATNSLTQPDVIKPVETKASFQGATWQHTVPALTIEVVDVVIQ